MSVILVPASTWFVMNSLKKARETVIPPDESINIYVQSLVKIYERENRWAREWKAGARIRERLGLEKTFQSMERYDSGIVAVSVVAFMIYFTYFYLKKGFWIFLFSIATWFFLSAIWNHSKNYLRTFLQKEKKILKETYSGY